MSDSRQRRSKSYRGCTPCKLARRKCTEEKPECSYCHKIGVKCEYDTESLFRFQEFHYENGGKRLTQSAKREPDKKRKADSTLEISSAAKRRHLAPKSQAVAHKDLISDLPVVSSGTSMSTAPALIAPLSELPWPTLPDRDPFHELLYDDEANVSESSSNESTPQDASCLFKYSPAPIPDTEIRPNDLPYFNFFLEEMADVLPYANLFPSAIHGLFSGSIHHKALRHSVLSISALIADKKSALGKERALEHLQKSMTLINSSLSAVEVDEGMAISIFMLAYIHVASGEHSTARKHLRGLGMVLDQLQQDHFVRNGGRKSPFAMSPLTMLVWRMAIRMDFIIAIIYARRPVFPLIAQDQEEFHRQWIVSFADQTQGASAAEWALAWFALDNMMHRACHISADAMAIRQTRGPSSTVELEIEACVQPLLQRHREWRDRPVVREAVERERNGQLIYELSSIKNTGLPLDLSAILPTAQVPSEELSEDIPMAFLDYSPMYLTNFFWNNLLNHWRSIEIYISLITTPDWGSCEPIRLASAVELCRTHAALGKERNFLTTGKIWGLHLAGIAFGGPDSYQRESQWIIDRLQDIESYYYAAGMVAGNLKKIWERKGNYWESAAELFKEICEAEGVYD